jgi:hypothetical protein
MPVDRSIRKLPPPPPARQLVTLPVFAEHVGCHARTVRRWCAAGISPVYRLPRTGERPGPLLVNLADV